MRMIDATSPNADTRGRAIDMIILHYTGMTTGAEALARLTDAASRVSAHYLIEEDGRIFKLVEEDLRAWHAGVSSWKGEGEINARSIGIEIVNPGHEWGYRDFPPAQIAALLGLLHDIRARRAIAAQRVLAHSDVAPGRKEDPGERFPWDALAAEGLAIGTYRGDADPQITYDAAARWLAQIGYEIAEAAPGKAAPSAALLAFQRRFAPRALGQGWSPLTKAALRWTATAMG